LSEVADAMIEAQNLMARNTGARFSTKRIIELTPSALQGMLPEAEHVLAVTSSLAVVHCLRRFLKKNFPIQEVGAGLIKMSYLGNSGWRSRRFSTARLARLLSVTPFW
jgi:hypothetical protein